MKKMIWGGGATYLQHVFLEDRIHHWKQTYTGILRIIPVLTASGKNSVALWSASSMVILHYPRRVNNQLQKTATPKFPTP